MTDRELLYKCEAQNAQAGFELRTADGEVVCSGGPKICVANIDRLTDQFGELEVRCTNPPRFPLQ